MEFDNTKLSTCWIQLGTLCYAFYFSRRTLSRFNEDLNLCNCVSQAGVLEKPWPATDLLWKLSSVSASSWFLWTFNTHEICSILHIIKPALTIRIHQNYEKKDKYLFSVWHINTWNTLWFDLINQMHFIACIAILYFLFKQNTFYWTKNKHPPRNIYFKT